jgi:hypothetical protein
MRALVEGFEYPPAVLMPYNPPYYAELLEAVGLCKAKDLLAYELTSQALTDRLRRGQELVRQRYGIWVRAMDFRNRQLFRQDVEHIKEIYNRAWQPNWALSGSPMPKWTRWSRVCARLPIPSWQSSPTEAMPHRLCPGAAGHQPGALVQPLRAAAAGAVVPTHAAALH